MELITATLSEFTKRSRSLSIGHAETGLQRGLEYGERVIVLSGSEYRTAVVADLSFTSDDTHYRLVLGGRVPAETAEACLIGEIDVRRTSGQVSVHDVADMLARSGAVHRIPLQREVARRLQDR